jgi:hypothetical protein
MMAVLGLFLIMIVVMFFISRRQGKLVSFWKGMIFMGGPLVVFLVLVAYTLYSLWVLEPPFGF